MKVDLNVPRRLVGLLRDWCNGWLGSHGVAPPMPVPLQDDRDHQWAQAQANKANERLAIATEIVGIGMWEWDLQTRILSWDEQMYRLAGRGVDAKSPALPVLLESLHPGDRERFESDLRIAIQCRSPFGGDYRLVWPRGEVHHIRAAARTIVGPDNRVVRLTGASFDITALKVAQESLAVSDAFMGRAGRIAGVGGWRVDLVKQKIHWSKVTRSIHEVADDFEPQLDQAIDFYAPEARPVIESAVNDAITNGTPWDLELPLITAKGRRLWVRAVGEVEFADGRPLALVGAFQDITERRARDQALQDAVQRAEQASASKGQFLANMSHEIRTPMNAIIGMLSLLHHTELTPQQLDYADKSQTAAHSLLGLINDILDFSKAEAGKMALDPQPFRVDRLMRDLAVILSANVGAKGIEVLYDIAQNVPPVLLGDSMRLQQILINLAGNAVKFTAHGQVVIAIRVAQVSNAAVALQFAVQDSGIGIAPENQARIFAGFSQAEASTTRKFGGTGLGLAISRRLIEIMGGELHLQSALGEGSTFSFALEFPLVADVPPALQTEPRLSVQPKRVLVIDDNPVARDLIASMARSWNWPTQAVDSGEAALQRITENASGGTFPFDVIYMDWHMPGMDGWETTQRIRQLAEAHGRDALSIIMVTANSRETLGQRTEQEQSLIDGFLVKPITPSMLQDATVRPQAAHAGLRKGQRPVASQRRLQGLRILVVEDNLLNQQVAEELLQTEGALVSLAANGQLGVEAVQAAVPQFDAVLMDLQMPVLDGFAATRVIRDGLKLAELPIIAMTANAMASDRDECMAAGMNEHVGKPFNLTQLVNTLLRFTRPAVVLERRAAPAQYQPLPQPVPSPPNASPTSPTSQAIALAEALERMSGMQTLYVRLAREFVGSLPGAVANFRRSVPQDWASAVMQMHTLKGTSAMLGATALSALAARLEPMCKDTPDVHAVAQASAPLESLAKATAQALQQVIDTLEPSAPPEATPPAPHPGGDAQSVRPHLEALQALLAQSDLAALEKFADIRAHLGALPEAQLRPLEDALQNLALEDAHACCQTILANLAAAV